MVDKYNGAYGFLWMIKNSSSVECWKTIVGGCMC